LEWRERDANFRALAINHTLRRQHEALSAAVMLADMQQGHLAVAFVRPALDEWLWLTYLCKLDLAKANGLLLAMGRYDAIRSLSAQRDYIGDEAMTAQLWYPPGFVDVQVEQLPKVREELRRLGQVLGWGNSALPPARWLAEQVGEVAEYEYLHAATSRAVHFSAGEVLRRGWGTPGGILVTDKPEFREHLADFALDRLWRLWASTLVAVVDRLDNTGVHFEESIDVISETLGKLSRLGKVPLVHAAEWNLAPDGPLRIARPDDHD